MKFLVIYLILGYYILVTAADAISVQNIHEVEKMIIANLRRDNPNWNCTEKNFSLFSSPQGLNIMISGNEIQILAALDGFDFDTIILVDTKIVNTDFLKNTKSLRVLCIRNNAGNFQKINFYHLRNKKIKSLFLKNVEVSNFSDIKNLKLTILAFENVKNIKFPDFSDLSDLESFTAINMNVNDLKFLCKSSKLKFLWIDEEKPACISVLPENVQKRIKTNKFRVLR